MFKTIYRRRRNYARMRGAIFADSIPKGIVIVFKTHVNKLSALLLLPAALLFTCATVAAQDAATAAPAETQRAATVQKADAPDASRQKADATDVASNVEPAGDARVASDGERAVTRFESDTSATRAVGLDRAATERPLFVSDKFEWQNDPQASPTPTPQPTRTPLTPEEKMKRAARNAFLSPAGYATTAFGAAITEYTEDDLPHKTNEDRFADFASRWAIRFTSRATNTLLGGGVYPVLFKQDPRYRPSGSKNLFKRALHAASRVFVTDDDDGNLEPNYSRWAGSLTSSAIANLYEQSTPGRDRIGTDATFRRFGSSFTSGMVNNIIREFLGDLF